MLGHQRAQQTDGIRAAAGAGVILNVGEDDRLRGAVRQTQRLGDGLVRLVNAPGKIGFARMDGGGDPVGGGFGGVAVVAIDDKRRAAIGNIGRRKAGSVRDRDDALVVRAARSRRRPAALGFLDQGEEAARRLGLGALEHQRDQKIDLSIGLIERPALAQQPIKQRPARPPVAAMSICG